MSKIIVSQIVNRAISDIDRKAKEASMPEQFKRIQDAFSNDALLVNQEGLAALCGLITGFRPRTQNNKVAPFEVFAVVSKAETRVIKFALCVYAAGGSSYGISSMAEGNVQYQADTCRLATAEEADKFITEEVASWEDTALLIWVNTRLGANYLTPFLAEMDRQVGLPSAPAAASKKVS
jgi:hypothetical protein